MLDICRSHNVDHRRAKPYSVAGFKRKLHEARGRKLARDRGNLDDLPLGVVARVRAAVLSA